MRNRRCDRGPRALGAVPECSASGTVQTLVKRMSKLPNVRDVLRSAFMHEAFDRPVLERVRARQRATSNEQCASPDSARNVQHATQKDI